MKVTIFDTHEFEKNVIETANQNRHDLQFLNTRLTEHTVILAKGSSAVCLFVNDRADASVMSKLKEIGIKLIVLRSAGFNHVNIKAATQHGIVVARVPNYSPEAVAEHAVAMLLTLNRKTHRAHNRVREMNFSLDGLVGFNLSGKTVGVIGTGKIGKSFCQIMRGFGCRVLATDLKPDKEWAQANSVSYTDTNTLLRESRIVSLHIPLNETTQHIINSDALGIMQNDAILINTGRGALIEARALLNSLKRKQIGGACLDVYEEEAGVFFSDFSDTGIGDDILARLLTFPNVLITSHQAFLTNEALKNIAETTIENLNRFENKQDLGATRVSD